GASLSGAYQAVLFLAFSAFLANLGRELTKDLEDLEGDRGHKMTLPLLAGKTPVKSIVLFCYAFALAVGLFAGFRFYFEETWFLPLLVLAGVLFGHTGSLVIAGKFRRSQRFAKQAMLLSLLAFASVVL
ncbi:MAG TPA: hypothetical protein VJB16_00030, partial [archaeon]|nr:hypothetical protein [archaeon]